MPTLACCPPEKSTNQMPSAAVPAAHTRLPASSKLVRSSRELLRRHRDAEHDAGAPPGRGVHLGRPAHLDQPGPDRTGLAGTGWGDRRVITPAPVDHLDREMGGGDRHPDRRGRHPGEFVFVPRGAAGAEDDGWLVGLVVDMNDETTDLVILNADDFTGKPQAVIHLPHRVPPGFHGNWVAD